jgi:FSR family fosmidomycin resistance protein-like MFS transporter
MNSFPPLINLYALQIAKGFSVFYFVLLPIFYAEKLIDSSQLGSIGAFFIAMLILGAIVVAQWLHSIDTKKLLQIASVTAIFAAVILYIASTQSSVGLLLLSYGIMGLSSGIGLSATNVVAANFTQRGNRYKSFAKLNMIVDVIRIVFPLLVAFAVGVGASSAAILIIIFFACVFLFFSSTLDLSFSIKEEVPALKQLASVRANTPFLYMLLLEFLDSFSSSQLFVFLPLLFLAKGYSLQNSLLLQSFIFVGYISGRWFVSSLAHHFSGLRAIAYAEAGMVITIILILVAQPLWLLYVLSFALGVFARGTSPAIKALAFDTLNEKQMKKGSALHIVAGDSGSAFGQLIFGFFVTWFGVSSPFIAASVVALFIVALCLMKPVRIQN